MTSPPVTDYYLVEDLLTDDEREVRDRVRAFSDEQVVPIINAYWERGDFPFELVPKLAELGVVGGRIEGHGCPGLSAVALGLATMELERGDGGVSTFFGAHSGLAMGSIALLGSDEQSERWLPAMAKLELVGAFALTEPDHGSDIATGLAARARREGDSYVLSGRKRWIGNATFADLIVVWARDDDGEVGGFVVPKGTQGLRTDLMTGKIAKRSVWNAEITLEDVRLPREHRLAGARTFRDTARLLEGQRYTVAWQALGHAVACYEIALRYTREREQFGRPLAGFQLVQDKLARMLAEITSMQLICLRLSRLVAEDRMTPGMASLAKMNNSAKARQVAADARDLLGGNGILLEHHVARHWADMEAVHTYEGTDHIQALIVGRDITGVRAFT